MANAPDLAAWFARIGHTGPALPTLQTLKALIRLHAASIPFENLSPLLGEPVLLDPASLQDKLLHRRRGGWCFEHNRLLWVMLEALGFEVQGLAARVLWQQPEGAQPPRTHMLLRLVVDGEPWIADVGFGGLTFTAPLALQPDLVQHTPQGDYRLQSAGGGYVMQALLGEQWASLYSFDLTPQQPADYEATNWWLATHDSSRFLHMLAAARATADLRHTLRDCSYTCRDARGVVVAQQQVTTAVQAVRLLHEVFGIDVPQGDAVLARLDAVLNPAS